MRPRLTRLAVCLIASFLAATPLVGHVVEPPYHGDLHVQVLDFAGAVVATHRYSLGDWSGRWWSIDLTPVGPARDPLLVVGFESLSGLMSQSHIAVMRHTAGGRFSSVQVETIGNPGGEIHFVKMIRDGGGVVHLDVYEGQDPGAPLTVHHFIWNGAAFLPAGLRVEPLPVPPEALGRPGPADMRFGANIFFDVKTNSTVFGSSQLRLIPNATPPGLAVEANPRGGTFATTIGVTATATDPVATIHVTATSDGSEPPDPTAASPVLGPGGLWLLPRTFATTTWMVKLIARAGPLTSDVVREEYVIDASVLADSDGDGLPDIWEAANGFNPLLRDADRDSDGDGWSDFDEMRLGSDPGDPLSTGVESRQVRLSGSATRPDGVVVPLAPVLAFSPTGSDLIAGLVTATGAGGLFSDVRTLGENPVVLQIDDPNEPQIVLHRFTSDVFWDLPPRSWADSGFFSDPNDATDLDRLLDPNTWFDQYRSNLDYDIVVGGQSLDAASSAMLQVLEDRIEALAPQLVLDNWGVVVEADRDDAPPGNFPGPEDLDLDRNQRLDGFQIALGADSAGLTGARAELLERAGTPVSLLGATLQEAADDPVDPTYDSWIDFAEDVYRAVPSCAGFYGTTDEVLTDALDSQPLDAALSACFDALPALPPGGAAHAALSASPRMKGGVASVLPADLPGLIAATRAAAGAVSAILARALARGERAIYERGDGFATGVEYRGIINALVGKRAGDAPALGDIASGAEEVARAVEEARLLEAAGRTSAVQNLRAGAGVLAAALDAANGNAASLANLNARMNGLVYRIDRAGANAVLLAQLESVAPTFLTPDVAPPVVTVSPPGNLFTVSVSVTLLSDEPAILRYTRDGSDPAPGGASTFSGSNEITGIVITADTTLSWMAEDVPWGNATGISRVTWLRDADADAIADVSDNCPALFNPLQENFDGDALGDLCDADDDNDLVADGADCRPLDPALWSAPDGLPISLALTSPTIVQWTSLAPLAGGPTFYDLASGDLSLARSRPPSERFDDALCRLDDNAALSFTDNAPLPVGSTRWFLVRGENACGTGTYGADTQGVDRVVLACP